MTDPEDDSTSRARERIGKVLRDKWKIYDLLGIGGMAAIYAATHVNNGKRVAIKLLHPEVVTNAEARSRFLREGYVANKVDHPGTVQVLDDDIDDDGSVFLVMELLDGETFEARRVRSGNVLPAIDVLKVADRVLDVLATAHEKGIIHRDIKPDNIFLTNDGGVKLLDFGIARLRDSMRRATMTSGGAIGTPAFMPPEQARGRWNDVGPRTDLWALGATMFTALTGRLVHQADTVNELLLAAMTKPAPALASMLPGVSATVSAVVDRALAHEMDGRWPDARTMQSMVRMAFHSLGDPGGGSNGRWGGTVRIPNGGATPELAGRPTVAARGAVPAMGGLMAGPLIAPPPGSVPLLTGAPLPTADPITSSGRAPYPMADPITGAGRGSGMIADPGSVTGSHAAVLASPNARPPPPQFASGGFSSAMTAPMPQAMGMGQAVTIGRAAAPKPATSNTALIVILLGVLLLVIGIVLVLVLRHAPAKDPASSSPTSDLNALAAASSSAPAPAERAAEPPASAAPTASAVAPPAPSASAASSAPAPVKPGRPTVKKR
jgi:eukaryotic-like serine/threonine-protein kinase